jgi:arylsulfatase A-like enzyme
MLTMPPRKSAWILLALAGVVLAKSARAADEAPQTRTRPNFLFVYTDDQRFDAMSVVQREQNERARFPWFQTPNMDRLAAEGVRFRNAFVVSSLCAPSRAAFLTGRYNHLNGIANNHTPFPAESMTYASLLQAAGYVTGYIGKWHMDGQRGQRPGFSYSASFIGQGRYVDCPFEINGMSTPSEGWVDDRSTDFAIEFLRKHRDQPFALVVGFKACHGPFDPPDRARNRFAGEVARKVPNQEVPPGYSPAERKDQPRAKATAKAKAKAAAKTNLRNPAPPGEAERAGVSLNYFRCISAADDNLGRLLGALDELRIAENTVVVFTSDNGFYLGEHRLGDKRSAYEESLRIPFLVRYPQVGRKGVTADEMVLNIDLAPTILDFAGVPIPREMQGRSLRPLLEGRETRWRSAWFYEYFFERPYAIPTVLAVRTSSAKLIKYPGHDDWTELFDLQADPYETKNLARDPAQKPLLDRMEQEFQQQAHAVDFRVPSYADEAQSTR